MKPNISACKILSKKALRYKFDKKNLTKPRKLHVSV